MNKYDECQRPFSACWCETRPNNPKCKSTPEFSIESDILSVILVISILFVVRKYLIPIKNGK